MATLKASEQGKKRIQQARNDKGWNVDDPRWLVEASKILEPHRNWELESPPFASGVSEGTWKAFLYRQRGIEAEVFKTYCKVLGLPWEEIREATHESAISHKNFDWHKICRQMLETQKRSIRRQATEVVSEPFYVQLGLVERKHQPRRSSDFSISPEQGSGFFQPTREEIIKTYEHDDFLEQVIQQGQSKSEGKHIAIIGEPGAGKTTLLEAIAFSPLTPGFPIWISLGSLGEKSLEQYLREKWLKDALPFISPEAIDVTPELEKELAKLFNSDEVLLLLDGVDEMPAPSPVQALAKIREELTGWIAKARVVLTCRVNVWDASINALQGFDTYRTLEFSYGDGNKPDQVREFICQWFSNTDKPDLGERLREKLDEDRHQRIRDLVKNPLRLSLLCQSWYFPQGDLPETKAALYEQFRRAFYDWKEEQFPITLTKRKELNAALGLLAREAIDKEQSRFGIRESFASNVMGEDLFNLACKLHWLNFVYKDADTHEKVYAFFHPTFQEYFAACAINDWHYLLNHVRQNLYNPKATYRIFEQQWKEVFLLWLGREEVAKEQKEEFIWKLGEFEDGCNNFYWFRAYFLAAAGIDQFQDCRWTAQIVDQLIKWSFGYFDNDKQEWQVFPSPIAQGARAALLETNRSQAIKALTQLLNTPQDEDILLDAAIMLVQLNASDQDIIIGTLSKLLDSQNKTIRSEAAYRLGLFAPINSKAKETLKDCLNNNQSDILVSSTTPQILQDSLSTELVKIKRSSVALKLLQIDPGNLEALKILNKPLDNNQNKNSVLRNDKPLAQFTTTILHSAEGLSVEIVLNDAQPNYIDALIEILHTSQDNLTCGLLISILGKVGSGRSDVASELIHLLRTSRDWYMSELATGSLMTILEGKILSAIVQDLKDCLAAQVKENDLALFWFSYKAIWHCVQNMTYPDFYYAWHGQSSVVQSLEN